MIVGFSRVVAVEIENWLYTLHQAARVDDDRHLSRPTLAANGLHRLDNTVALDHLPKDDVLAIEMGRARNAEEKLRAVCAGPGVGHRQHARPGVAEVEVLIFELSTVDGLAARACSTQTDTHTI